MATGDQSAPDTVVAAASGCCPLMSSTYAGLRVIPKCHSADDHVPSGPKPASSRVLPLDVIEPARLPVQLVAEIRMGNGDEVGDAFADAAPEQLRDAELGHDRPNVGSARHDAGARREHGHDPRDRAAGRRSTAAR